MARNASDIQAKSNPEMLVLRGSTVSADVTVTFPPRFFSEMAILRITPVLIFDGGEIAGTPKFLQGEKVRDNFTVISWRNGGSYTQTVSFPYDPRADISTLVLRVEAKCSESCTERFNNYLPLTAYGRSARNNPNSGDIVVARGISTLQNLANNQYLSFMDDDFKRVRTISPDDVYIMYEINKAVVRPAQLTQSQVALLEGFVRDNSEKADVTMNSVYFNGYASPDGPVAFNDKLSKARGESAKSAMGKELPAMGVKYDIAPYGEDWDGFKKLVEQSNIQDKALILQVLQMYSDPVQREQEIRNMSAVFDVLAKEILPQLRRATVSTSAQVQGPSDAELISAAKSNPSSLGLEDLLFAATLTDDNALKASIYSFAAEKFNDARAYNNLGAVLIEQGKFAEAQKALNKAASLKSSPEVSNNLGALALAQGNLDEARKYLSSLNTPEAIANKGLVALAEGDAASAQKNLQGFNLALAQVIEGNNSAANSALSNDTSAEADYLRAVIAARQGNSAGVISNLKNAISKNADFRSRAKNDIEFVKFFDNPEFKAL